MTANMWHDKGMIEQVKHNHSAAILCFLEAMKCINRYGPSFERIKNYSDQYYHEAIHFLQKGEAQKACEMLVRARELNPDNILIKNDLEKILAQNIRLDYTKHCFIDRKGERARNIRYETFLRCIEFLTVSGIVGDILEFGVLAGWSARIIAEIMRDEMFLGNLHLFDSFEGLPLISSDIDDRSFDKGIRNLWHDNMKFSDDFIKSLGSPIEQHIKDSLSEVLTPSRIHIHKGFYSESLNSSLDIRAALVHIDCDLYSSTTDVLDGLVRNNALQDGCLLVFDDWNCNKANPNYGERRAFIEFMKKHEDKLLSSEFFTYGHNGAVFIIHDKTI